MGSPRDAPVDIGYLSKKEGRREGVQANISYVKFFGGGCGGISIGDKINKNDPNCSRNIYISHFEEVPMNILPMKF